MLHFRTMIDEYSRKNPAIRFARGIGSDKMPNWVRGLFASEAMPEQIRSHNGKKFAAATLEKCLADLLVKTAQIEPNRPWRNRCFRSFNARMR